MKSEDFLKVKGHLAWRLEDGGKLHKCCNECGKQMVALERNLQGHYGSKHPEVKEPKWLPYDKVPPNLEYTKWDPFMADVHVKMPPIASKHMKKGYDTLYYRAETAEAKSDASSRELSELMPKLMKTEKQLEKQK